MESRRQEKADLEGAIRAHESEHAKETERLRHEYDKRCEAIASQEAASRVREGSLLAGFEQFHADLESALRAEELERKLQKERDKFAALKDEIKEERHNLQEFPEKSQHQHQVIGYKKQELEEVYLAKERTHQYEFEQHKASLEGAVRAREEELNHKEALLKEEEKRISEQAAREKSRVDKERAELRELERSLEAKAFQQRETLRWQYHEQLEQMRSTYNKKLEAIDLEALALQTKSMETKPGLEVPPKRTYLKAMAFGVVGFFLVCCLYLLAVRYGEHMPSLRFYRMFPPEGPVKTTAQEPPSSAVTEKTRKPETRREKRTESPPEKPDLPPGHLPGFRETGRALVTDTTF